MLYQWQISIEVMPEGALVGDEIEYVLDVRDETAPMAVITAINTIANQMQPKDGFHVIHVGRAAPLAKSVTARTVTLRPPRKNKWPRKIKT